LISAGGPWNRVVDYEWMEKPPPGETGPPQPLWPGGAALRGARFTPPGQFGSLYFSEDPLTAQIEAEKIFQSSSGKLFPIKRPPWVNLTIEGVLNRLLDLTDPSIRQRLGTSLAELTGVWHLSEETPPTQLLGAAAYASGRIAGLRYRSAKSQAGPEGGINFVVFPDRLAPDSHLAVYHGGSLSQRFP
jgi:RES domain-containing protein